MRGKALFIVGLATGYVLGAKAGRQRYNQIAEAAGRMWNKPSVQRTVDNVEGFVKGRVPDVADLAAEGTRRVVNAAKARRAGSKTAGGGAPDATGPGTDSVS